MYSITEVEMYSVVSKAVNLLVMMLEKMNVMMFRMLEKILLNRNYIFDENVGHIALINNRDLL